MGKIRPPLRVKLFVGMLSADQNLLNTCAGILSKRYGPIDYVSDSFVWDKTDYYAAEMGDGLIRQFVFFQETEHPDILPSVKQFTASIEESYADIVDGRKKRRINLDPGYVTEAKVVLASTKDFAHRIYIGAGIYAEVTLRYCSQCRQFVELDHTFPDFRSDAYRSLFLRARGLLRSDLKRRGETR